MVQIDPTLKSKVVLKYWDLFQVDKNVEKNIFCILGVISGPQNGLFSQYHAIFGGLK